MNRNQLKGPEYVRSLLEHSFSIVLVCVYLFLSRTKLNDVIDAIPKSKKNKRCQLHSLDNHKLKPLG